MLRFFCFVFRSDITADVKSYCSAAVKKAHSSTCSDRDNEASMPQYRAPVKLYLEHTPSIHVAPNT